MAERCLRLAFSRQFPKQFLSQDFRRRRANLSALSTRAGRDGQDLASDPVRALVRLAINFAGYRVATWRFVHDVITADDKVS